MIRRSFIPRCFAALLLTLLSLNGTSSAQPQNTAGFINDYFARQWQNLKLTPSERTSDDEFIRRATLDIIGRIPTVEEWTAFAGDKAPDKRAKLIDRLLDSEDYASYWATVWTYWLLPRTMLAHCYEQTAPIAAGGESVPVPVHVSYHFLYRSQLHLWLQEAFDAKMPADQMVTELLTATGKTNDNCSVNFLLAHLGKANPPNQIARDGQFDMVPATERTLRLFLGYRLQPLQLPGNPKNHPDYQEQHFWGINAFFRQVERIGQIADPPDATQYEGAILELRDHDLHNAQGIVFFEKPGGVVLSTKAKYLNGTSIKEGEKRTRREVLAELITSDSQFARAMVNRIWGQVFGRGLNRSPAVDDFGSHNPVVHPELLDRLAADFKAAGYDFHWLLRTICTSNPYQRKSTVNPSNADAKTEVYFSRMPVKLMNPEQLVNSLWTAARPDHRASRTFRSVADGYFNRRFDGNEWADVPCTDQLIHVQRFLNQENIARVLLRLDGGTLRMARAEPLKNLVPEMLFLAALGRRPTADESKTIQAEIAREKQDFAALWQDLYWALLNSSEFVLNH